MLMCTFVDLCLLLILRKYHNNKHALEHHSNKSFGSADKLQVGAAEDSGPCAVDRCIIDQLPKKMKSI